MTLEVLLVLILILFWSSSIFTFAVGSVMLFINEAVVEAGTATIPASATLAGIEISIARSRLLVPAAMPSS